MTDERARIEGLLNPSGTFARLMSLWALGAGERLFLIDLEHVARAPRTEQSVPTAPTSVAVLPLFGALSPRGGGSMESFRSRLADVTANPDVGQVVLDIDSPGGTYSGTPETAAAVAAAAQVKPITAVVDSLAASAAYWIASQATSIVMSPSSDVGSIGVLALHLEISQLLADNGIKPTIIRSVPNKAEGNMFEPLSDDAQAAIKSSVDDAHGEFIRAVASGRKTSQAKVSDEFGKGRTISAQQAVRLGMADKIGTMGDVLAGMRTKSGTLRRRSAFTF